MPIKVCDEKTFSHRVDRLTQFLHHPILSTLLEAFHIHTLRNDATCTQKLLINSRRACSAPCPSLGLLLVFLPLLRGLDGCLAKGLPFLHILDNILHFSGEVITLHVGQDSGIILTAGKVQIIRIRHITHDATTLTILQHVLIPLT